MDAFVLFARCSWRLLVTRQARLYSLQNKTNKAIAAAHDAATRAPHDAIHH